MKPIGFTNEMVCAILEGSKTQTRRIIKGHSIEDITKIHEKNDQYLLEVCPFGQPGDVLYVKESHKIDYYNASRYFTIEFHSGPLKYFYADQLSKTTVENLLKRKTLNKGQFVSGRFMPKELARTKLRITNVRVERLQSISNEDAIAEGIDVITHQDKYPIDYYRDYLKLGLMLRSPRASFNSLWSLIHGADSLIENPWVYVVEFLEVEA